MPSNTRHVLFCADDSRLGKRCRCLFVLAKEEGYKASSVLRRSCHCTTKQNMSCLTHHKRFRALFHNVVNELRSENQTPVSVLHGMPRLCCTCNDEVTEKVTLNEYNAFAKLNNLIEKVIREKDPNAKLILSANRLGQLIKEHRVTSPPAAVEKQSTVRVPSPSDGVGRRNVTYDMPSSSDSSSSSGAEDFAPMDLGRPLSKFIVRRSQIPTQPTGKSKRPQPSKPLKSGTFVFLPYTSNKRDNKQQSDSLLEVAKNLQRNRFISAGGLISQLEKEYHVRMNMITPKTSHQITDALERAKKALGSLKIYDEKKALKTAAEKDGEWLVVRSKSAKPDTKEKDIDQAIEDLTSRWTRCLTFDKRTCRQDDRARPSKRGRK